MITIRPLNNFIHLSGEKGRTDYLSGLIVPAGVQFICMGIDGKIF